MTGIRRLDPADTATVAAMHAVHAAALQADDPDGPPWSLRGFGVRLTLGPPAAEPGEAWYVQDSAGSVTAWCKLQLPDMENLDRASLELFVHPAWRRRGLGGALLRHAAGRAASHGRVLLHTVVAQDSPGEAFARQAGASFGLAEARRVLDLDSVPSGMIARCREVAAKAATGYSLASWTGATPEEHLAGVAEMFTAMNDAPDMPGAEPDIWDAERVRVRLDGRMEQFGSRGYMLVALHDGTGEMVALTELRVDPDVPGWAQQGNTVVGRAHRGHRLGLLVKAAMLEWLARAEPSVRRISTWNAVVNRHMIAINEDLGFAVSGPRYLETEFRVAGLLGTASALAGSALAGSALAGSALAGNVSHRSPGGAAAWGRAAIPWRS